MGSLSNDDCDGKENGKKSVGSYYGHRLFFRLASNTFPDIGSVGRIEKKSLEVSE